MDGLGSLLILALPLLLLFVLISRARRSQRTMQAVQQGLRPGMQIITTAGLYAEVVGIEGDVVLLETGAGQQSRWARAAIGRILDEPAASPPAADEPDDDTV